MGTQQTNEALKAQINTGISDSRTPLRHFKGKFDDFKPEHNERYNRLEVKLLFSDLEVFKSTMPYPWKTMEMPPMGYNPAGNTASSSFGILSASLNGILGKSVPLSDLVGKVWELKFTSGHKVQRLDSATEQWVDQEIEAWEVVSLDGVQSSGDTVPSTPSPVVDQDSLVVSLALGVDDPGFERAALSNQELRKFPIYQEIVTQGAAVLAGYIASDKLIKGEDGKYQAPT